jgi:hypothetical protein
MEGLVEDIAILKDPVEYSMVVKMIKRDDKIGYNANSYVYFGLYYNRTVGKKGTYPQSGWLWSDGTPFDITNLNISLLDLLVYPGQPYPANVSIRGDGYFWDLGTVCTTGRYTYAVCQIPSNF